MINKTEVGLFALSSSLLGYYVYNRSKYGQINKGIGLITLGTTLLMHANRGSENFFKSKTKITAIALGSLSIAWGIFEIYSAYQNIPEIPSFDKWQVTISKSLHQVPGFGEYSIGEEIALYDSHESVGWDHYLIRSINEKKLFTSQLGPCVGIAVRGYDQTGKLTHIGLAHKFRNENLHTVLFQKMREAVGKGHIEAFIAGGNDRQSKYLNKIISFAKKNQIQIVDNLTKKFFKSFNLFCEKTIYSGSSGISQIYFDQASNPHLYGDILFNGVENLTKILSNSACTIQAAPQLKMN